MRPVGLDRMAAETQRTNFFRAPAAFDFGDEFGCDDFGFRRRSVYFGGSSRQAERQKAEKALLLWKNV